MTTENFQGWGWRIAFVVGALLGPVGYYLRTRTAETPVFRQVEVRKTIASSPLLVALSTHWKTIVAGICICAIAAASTQTFQIYLTQFARQQLKLDATASLLITSASLAFAAIYILCIGRLSDNIGRKTLVLASSIGFIVFTYPLFAMLAASPTLTTYLIVQFAGAALYGLVFGVLPTLLAELFPTKVRYTGISISFSIAIMSFGGFTPFINTYLVQATGNSAAPAFWVMAVAVLSGIAMLMTKDRTNVAFD